MAGYHTLHPELVEVAVLRLLAFVILRPVWLVPFGIVFEGVSLAWFYLIQKEPPRWRSLSETGTGRLLALFQDCEKGHFFPSPALNTLVSYLLRGSLRRASCDRPHHHEKGSRTLRNLDATTAGWELHMAVAIMLTATQAIEMYGSCSCGVAA